MHDGQRPSSRRRRYEVLTAVTANLSTLLRCPPVDTLTVSTLSMAPWNDTVACHGVPSPPAAVQHDSPSGAADESCRTSAWMASSTP